MSERGERQHMRPPVRAERVTEQSWPRHVACHLAGLPRRQLDLWLRSHLLGEDQGLSTRDLLTFDDLVRLRLAKWLVTAGVPLSSVRVAMASLGDNLEGQFDATVVLADGCTVFVCHSAEEILTVLSSSTAARGIVLRRLVEDVLRELSRTDTSPVDTRQAAEA